MIDLKRAGISHLITAILGHLLSLSYIYLSIYLLPFKICIAMLYADEV
jgi:hypothetical protein